jgi:hypothetical protein
LRAHALEGRDQPDDRPKTDVSTMGGIKSVNVASLKPVSKKKQSEIGSAHIAVIQAIAMLTKSAAMVSSGSINVHARTRVAPRYLWGSTADASMASICSVSFIELEPTSTPFPH